MVSEIRAVLKACLDHFVPKLITVGGENVCINNNWSSQYPSKIYAYRNIGYFSAVATKFNLSYLTNSLLLTAKIIYSVSFVLCVYVNRELDFTDCPNNNIQLFPLISTRPLHYHTDVRTNLNTFPTDEYDAPQGPTVVGTGSGTPEVPEPPSAQGIAGPPCLWGS